MSGIPAGAGSLLGKRLGKYEILALLALGGTAEIYLARIGGAAGFEKYVVVKCLHDHLADDTEFVKMFLDEARLAAQLDHSNIVQTFELGEHENRYYMVMEFLAGLSLAMIVRRVQERLPGGKMPVNLILNIASQACAGLHYAHERTQHGKPLNMVHRDISPQNLVIGFEGVVKVVDFGIARAEYRETKTKAGTIKGKFAYMSPEQCVATNVDRRTDVFALGVILWELMTSKRLFKRNSPYETYQAVIECVVPAPSSINHEIDAELDAIVLKACAKEKEDRYASAEALGDAVQGYLHHRGKGSGPADVGRFFDEFFAQEIEEHGERMRELIAGRENVSVDTGVSWGDEDDAKANETVDLGSKAAKTAKSKLDKAVSENASIELTGGDLIEVRPSQASLDQVVGNLDSRMGDEGANDDDDDGGGGDDDDMPAERTRIEANPLEKIAELEASTKSHVPIPPGSVTGGPAPLPAPPTPPFVRPVSANAAAKFPERANMPTQIASDAKIENAATELGGSPIDPSDPRAMSPSMQQVHPPIVAQPQPGAPHQRAHAYSATQQAVRVSAMQNAQQQPMQNAQQQPMQDPSMQGQPQGPYPMGPGGGSPYPGGPGGGSPYPMAPPGGGSPYPVVSGRPYSTDLAPSQLPSPQHSPYAGKPATPDAQHSMNMMSPVGDQYGHHVNWEAAAAQRARALPPWLLAVLFVGALGIALTLTIVIAKIIR
jgi:serine/threonine-protein kinase